MKPARRPSRVAATLTAVLLAACGGGGGGGGGSQSPLQYNGNASAAVVSETNASTLVNNVLGAGDVGQTIAGAASVTGPDAVALVHEGQQAVARRLSRRLGDAVAQAARLRAVQGAIPVDETEPCDSGSVRRNGTLNDNGTGTLTVTFNDCREGGETLGGQATVRVDAFDFGVFLPTDFTITFARVTLRGAGLSLDVGGSLRVQLNVSGLTETITQNVVALNNLSGSMTKSENLVYVTVYDNIFFPSSLSVTISGRVFDHVHGFVDVTTLVSVAFGSLDQTFPHAGQVRLDGAGGRAVRATARSTSLVVLELDLDGDGVFERAATLAWTDLSGPMGSNLADSDGDGMHDAWETAHQLNPQDLGDAALDSDGDGATNLAEYLGGTDPSNPASVPQFPVPPPPPPPPPGPQPTPVPFAGMVVGVPAVTDLVYDPGTQRLYASVGTSPGSVLPIDPTNGATGMPIAVDNVPVKLVRSDDGQFLYVGFQLEPKVQRINLAMQMVDLTISLGTGLFNEALVAEDIAVSPGSPQSIAVSLKSTFLSPHHQGVAVFDGAVRRPTTAQAPGGIGSNVIEFSASSATLYGYDNTIGSGFYRMAVTPGGVTISTSLGGLVSGLGVDIHSHGGVVYTTSGLAINPTLMVPIGSFALPAPIARSVVADASTGRVFYLTASDGVTAIRAYDLSTFASLSAVNATDEGAAARSLVRWGAKGLAFRTSTGQVFITQQSDLIP